MNLKFVLVTQFFLLIFNLYIFPIKCERVDFQETEILGDNKYVKNFQETNCGIKGLKLKNQSNFTENEHFKESDWFSNIPLLPIAVATSNSIPEGPCKTQLRLFLNHLKNGTLWAVEMFDSSAKYPYGIFDGLTRYLGSFDQCNRIKATVSSDIKNGEEFEEIRSKYCLVEIKYQKRDESPNFSGKYDLSFDPHDSAWEAIKETGDISRYKRNVLQMALCFPAKCQMEEIIAAFKEPLEKFNEQFNLQVNATIHPEYCHVNHESLKLSNYDKVYCFFLFLIITLVVISTILDVQSGDKEKNCYSTNLLDCFSARRSLNVIFKVKYNHNAFDCLHLIRCIFASVTIAAHRNLELIQGGNITGLHFEKDSRKPFLGFIYNADISVDGFFGISGTLLSYYLLEFLENSNKLKIFPLIFKRYIRLAPSYMFVTFSYVFLIHHLGSGPFWESRLGYDRDACASNWWTNLFFIHNYVNAENMCVVQSWFLAVDYHCFIIGLLLIGVFNKIPRKIGYIFLGCTLFVSIVIPFYVTYYNNIDSFIRMDLRLQRIETNDYCINYYVKTHMRLSAYIVGLIMGVLMYDYKFVVWRLSKFSSHVLFISQGVALPLLFQWFASYFIDHNSQPSLFVKALYASLHRPVFAFSVCSILLLITIGQGLDFYYKLLTPKWIQPISKLSYATYLTHFAFQSYELGTARTVFTYSSYNLIKNFVGDLTYVLLLSLLFFIFIESPFTNLGNLLLREKKSTSKTSQITEKKVE